jgi:DNA-binding NarL/FixJ family response regulator
LETIRIAIVEDHPLIRQAVQEQLQGEPDIAVVLELAHGGRLLPSLRGAAVDIVLLDLGMDRGIFDPVTTVQRIRTQYPGVQVIVMSSASHGARALGVLRAGVDGYVLKSDLGTLDLAAIIRRVRSGGRYFSPEIEELLIVALETGSDGVVLDRDELDLIRLASQGHTNKEIGHMLGYSEKTVRNRLTPIFRKLGAANRVEAIRKAEALGLLG